MSMHFTQDKQGPFPLAPPLNLEGTRILAFLTSESEVELSRRGGATGDFNEEEGDRDGGGGG